MPVATRGPPHATVPCASRRHGRSRLVHKSRTPPALRTVALILSRCASSLLTWQRLAIRTRRRELNSCHGRSDSTRQHLTHTPWPRRRRPPDTHSASLTSLPPHLWDVQRTRTDTCYSLNRCGTTVLANIMTHNDSHRTLCGRMAESIRPCGLRPWSLHVVTPAYCAL